MRLEQIKMREENDKVILSAYLLDGSEELANTLIRPAVLIFPGGAYMGCSDREAEPVAMAFLAEGYQAFVLRYTTGKGTKFNQPLEDANRALELLHEKNKEWNIDVNKIAVLGFSAGGHLAAALGTMGRLRPSAMILGYPCILESMEGILPFPIPGIEKEVDEKTPSTYLFATCEDELVPIENTLRFMLALNEHRIPFESHIFQKGKHGLSLAKPLTSSGFSCFVDEKVQDWFPMAIDWLQGELGDFKADEEYHMAGVELEGDFYGLDTAIKVLWENAECKALLLEYIPAFYQEEVFEGAKEISLNILYQYTQSLINETGLRELGDQLKQIVRKN